MTIPRVHYRERQVLRKNDLIEEQRYRMRMLRAHQVTAHTWGIVNGLQLVGADAQLVVKAGVAVDGYGRFLTLSDDLTIDGKLIKNQLGEDDFDVWLTYWQQLDDNNRWQEEARLRLTEAASEPIAPRDLDRLGVDSLPIGDEETTANSVWPVYLGRVAFEPENLTILASKRPYTHLKSSQLATPSGEVQLGVGREQLDDPVHFNVSIDGQPRLTVDGQGKTAVYAKTHLQKEMVLESGSQLYFDQSIASPEVAAPWNLYKTAVVTEKKVTNQLRVELFHPGDKGNPADNQLVVGYWDDDQFVKCFQVGADKTVTVYKNVEMQPGKQINEGPVEMDLADERFAATLLGNMVSGMSSAAPQVDAIYNMPFEIRVALSSSPNNEDLTFDYTVTISNLTEAEVTNIQLLELQVIEGRSQKERTSENVLESLGKEDGTFSEKTAIFPDLPVNQKIMMIVSVIGTMPNGEQRQATATTNIVVQKKPKKK